jgi:hypothetical protein
VYHQPVFVGLLSRRIHSTVLEFGLCSCGVAPHSGGGPGDRAVQQCADVVGLCSRIQGT